MEADIRPWEDADLSLLERLMGDPDMTEHLGGPESREKIVDRHGRYLRSSQTARDAMFAIVAGPDRMAVGSIGYWELEWQGELALETGWSVLPEFQGKGLAASAAFLIVERAKAATSERFLYAFPAVDNMASNAICRKVGFEYLGVEDIEFPKGQSQGCMS